MRVRVDPPACEADGVCAGLAPEVFGLDDDDELRILKPDVPRRSATASGTPPGPARRPR